MDHAIVSRHTMRQRGARAFDQGRSVHDHHMNEGAPAIADWQQGWRERRAVVFAREIVVPQLRNGTPP